MNVLVTGGAGYLGAVLCAEFLHGGHTVTCVDPCWFLPAADHPCAGLPGFKLLSFGFEQCPPSLLVGQELICHLAGIANDPAGDLDREYTRQLNLDATVSFAAQARDCGVPAFLFTSSCSVYGSAGTTLCDESTPPHPQSWYARLKVAAEDALTRLATPGFRVLLPRLSTLCGYAPRLRLDLMLNTMVDHALRTGTVTVSGPGTQRRPLLHVNDAACALVALATGTAPAAPVLNIGAAPYNFTVTTVAKTVAALRPGIRIVQDASATPDSRDYAVDFSAFSGLFPAWQPVYTLAAAAAELADHLGNGTAYDPTSARYHNVLHLRTMLDAGAVQHDRH